MEKPCEYNIVERIQGLPMTGIGMTSMGCVWWGIVWLPGYSHAVVMTRTLHLNHQGAFQKPQSAKNRTELGWDPDIYSF